MSGSSSGGASPWGYFGAAWSSTWIQRHWPGATSCQTRRKIGGVGVGGAVLRRCGRASTLRSLAIVDLDPWGLVAAEMVGLVIGTRLPGERFFPDSSQTHPIRPSSVGAEVPPGERHPAHVGWSCGQPEDDR